MRNTPSAPSFVRSGERFHPAALAPRSSRKSALRFARAKKRPGGEKKAGEVINGRPNDSRVCDSETTSATTRRGRRIFMKALSLRAK